MINIKNINLRDLIRKFYDSTTAPDAVNWYKNKRRNKNVMTRVLRNHVTDGIWDPDE